jgi:hypothetical protein
MPRQESPIRQGELLAGWDCAVGMGGSFYTKCIRQRHPRFDICIVFLGLISCEWLVMAVKDTEVCDHRFLVAVGFESRIRIALCDQL